jgi:peptidoglycan/xylan/chitin deacetylase (PgdA/CDA1 family)
MDHYIEHVQDRGDKIRISLNTPPEEFDHQIKSLLDAGYTTHFVREVPAIINGEIPYDPKMIFITFDDGYEDFYTDVFPILKKYNIRSTAYIISDFIGHHNYMKENQLKEVIASGIVEIGSHSLTHPVLKDSSYEFAKHEIMQSKKDLSQRFKIRVETFAYPYGSFSGKDADLVKEAGYKAAVSVIPSVYQSEENMFYLYRIRPGEIGFNDTAKRLAEYRK